MKMNVTIQLGNRQSRESDRSDPKTKSSFSSFLMPFAKKSIYHFAGELISCTESVPSIGKKRCSRDHRSDNLIYIQLHASDCERCAKWNQQCSRSPELEFAIGILIIHLNRLIRSTDETWTGVSREHSLSEWIPHLSHFLMSEKWKYFFSCFIKSSLVSPAIWFNCIACLLII